MQAVHFTENPKYLYWKSKDQEKIAKFAGLLSFLQGLIHFYSIRDYRTIILLFL